MPDPFPPDSSPPDPLPPKLAAAYRAVAVDLGMPEDADPGAVRDILRSREGRSPSSASPLARMKAAIDRVREPPRPLRFKLSCEGSAGDVADALSRVFPTSAREKEVQAGRQREMIETFIEGTMPEIKSLLARLGGGVESKPKAVDPAVDPAAEPPDGDDPADA